MPSTFLSPTLEHRGRFWADLLADHDQRICFELAVMLDATRQPSTRASAKQA
jgi:hypothetical protein